MTPLTLTPGHRADGTAVLTVTGEIDMTNARGLHEAIAEAGGKVVVDLTAVDYLDSAGLSVLFSHADRIELIAPGLLVPLLDVSGISGLVTVRVQDEEHF
ncbi:STAS domain-containing protein [Actinacidiphila alni]|uniref:STAS domain-containing protein n=1 Tax=Actinacidiphila alni TaxID=380248 RepID=UPI0034537CCC